MDKETEEFDIKKDGDAAQKAALIKRLDELTAALNEAKGKKILPEEPVAPQWKRIVNGVIWGVLCVTFALLLLITAVAAISKAKGQTAQIFGLSMYVVLSDSMDPEIKVGDIIISQKVAYEKIKIGDDITFEGYVNGKKALITHRVIGFTADGFETQGTKQTEGTKPTEKPAYSEVYGKVVFKSTAIGAVYEFVGSEYGFLVVIVVPLFLFVIYESWALTKKFKALKAAGGEADASGTGIADAAEASAAEAVSVSEKDTAEATLPQAAAAAQSVPAPAAVGNEPVKSGGTTADIKNSADGDPPGKAKKPAVKKTSADTKPKSAVKKPGVGTRAKPKNQSAGASKKSAAGTSALRKKVSGTGKPGKTAADKEKPE